MQCQFSFAHLRSVFQLLKSRGYQSRLLSKALVAAPPRPAVILRHDLDQALENALVLALIEHEFGLKATFFVWLESPFYNPFEPSQAEIIRQIIRLDHALGLHLEVDPARLAELPEKVRRQSELLESFFSVNCQSVSFHRPAPKLFQQEFLISQRVNAYAPALLNSYKYVSDSRGKWREGCVCKLIKPAEFPYLYLLLHPLWWGDEDLKPKQRVEAYQQQKTRQLTADCQSHIWS